MDRLAESGVAFTNATVQAPLCNPSRTSFLTGFRPSTTGVYSLNTWFRDLEKYKDLVTLPQYFEQNGYVTLTTGKIFHGAFPPKEARRDGPEFIKWGFLGGYSPHDPWAGTLKSLLSLQMPSHFPWTTVLFSPMP